MAGSLIAGIQQLKARRSSDIGSLAILEAYEKRRHVKKRVKELSEERWNHWESRRGSAEDLIAEEDEEPSDPPLVRFRRMARLVRILCGVCLALRRYAINAGFLEHYTVTVTHRRTRRASGEGQAGDDTAEEEELLDFDPRKFRVRQDPDVPQSVKDSCQKRPEERSAEEIKNIALCMRAMPSFRKYTKEMQELLCKIVRYEKCENRRVVLRKGHIGYNLYFLYSGSVNVVLSKDPDSVFTKKDLILLTRGACFGEIALVQNTRRNATIVCAENCEFFVVDKDDFVENGLDMRMREEFNLRFKFFRRWSLLEDQDDNIIHQLSLQSRLVEFNHNKVVVKDSRDNEWLYFVIRGSCDVLRIVDLEGCPEYKRIFSSNLESPRTPSTLSSPHLKVEYGESSPRRVRPKTAGAVLQRHRAADDKPSITVTSAEDTSHRLHGSKEVINSDIGPGVFVKIDMLRDGGCYGLDAVNEEPPFTSLVSQACEVIQLSKAKFCEIVPEAVLSCLKKVCRPLPRDVEVFKSFMVKNKWDSYKQEVLALTLNDKKKDRDFESSLRGLKKGRYRSYQEMRAASPYADADCGHEPITLSIALHDLTSNLRSDHKRATSCLTASARYTHGDSGRERPKTCVPRMRTSTASSRPKTPLIPLLHQKYTNSSESINSGYRLKTAPVYAKGSKRTLQLVAGVESSAHEHRMRTIETQ